MKTIARYLLSWVAPHSSIKDPALHRQAQFISAMVLFTIPVIWFLEIIYLFSVPDSNSIYIVVVGSVCFLAIYLLNRTPMVALATFLTVFVSALLIVWMAALNPPEDYLLLIYLLFTLIMGVYFYNYLNAILVAVFLLATTLFYGVVFPEVAFEEILNGPFSVLLFFSVVLLLLKHYLQAVEMDRQRDLEEHEERYRALLEASFEGICSQVDGKIIEANHGIDHLFAYEPGEVLGLSILSLFAPEERVNLEMRAGRLFDGICEVHMMRKDGSDFHAEVNSHLQQIKGKVVEVIAIRNISVRKWSEEALHQAYDELEEMVDDRTKELKMANNRLQREVDERKEAEQLQEALYQISEAVHTVSSPQKLYPVLHKIISELIPARNLYFALLDDYKRVCFPYFVDEKDQIPAPHPLGDGGPTDWVIKNGEPLLLVPENIESLSDILSNGGGTPSDNWLGVPLKTSDGQTIGALVVQNYLENDLPGMRYGERDKEILSFVSTQVGLSIERQRAIQDLAVSEERFRSISEITTDFAYSYRVDEKNNLELEWMTGAISTITGYLLDEIRTKGGLYKSITYSDDLPIFRRRLKKLLTNQDDVSELRIETKKGEIRYLRQITRPVYDPKKNRVVRILGAAQDVTERKLMEYELLKAHQELEQRVVERTSELARVNENLKAEIQERHAAEEALRSSERALLKAYNENNQLLLAIQSILIGVDSQGNINHWNASATDVFGFSQSEVFGHPFSSININWDWETIRQAVNACLEKNEIIHLNDVYYGKNVVMDMTISPFSDHLHHGLGYLILGTGMTQVQVVE